MTGTLWERERVAAVRWEGYDQHIHNPHLHRATNVALPPSMLLDTPVGKV